MTKREWSARHYLKKADALYETRESNCIISVGVVPQPLPTLLNLPSQDSARRGRMYVTFSSSSSPLFKVDGSR